MLTLTINNMARKMFGNQWSTVAHTQKGYLRKNLHMGNMEPDYFYKHLKKINSYLPYFPYKDGMGTFKTLEEDELICHSDSADTFPSAEKYVFFCRIPVFHCFFSLNFCRTLPTLMMTLAAMTLLFMR